MNLFLYWLWIMFAFVCGMGLMAILKRQPDDGCRNCDMAYRDTIRRLEEQLATEKKRVSAFKGECNKLDVKLYQMQNRPSRGE